MWPFTKIKPSCSMHVMGFNTQNHIHRHELKCQICGNTIEEWNLATSVWANCPKCGNAEQADIILAFYRWQLKNGSMPKES